MPMHKTQGGTTTRSVPDTSIAVPYLRSGNPSAHRVLVITASKHGSTEEIGQRIAHHLAEAGFDVHMRSILDAVTVSTYSATIIGSAVYAGNWLKEARSFLEKNGKELSKQPVWLFSSGPLGKPPHPSCEEIMHMDEYVTAIGAVEHKLFAGSIDTRTLKVGERFMIKTLKVPDGDYRDWDNITAWATHIAQALQAHRKATAELV